MNMARLNPAPGNTNMGPADAAAGDMNTTSANVSSAKMSSAEVSAAKVATAVASACVATASVTPSASSEDSCWDCGATHEDGGDGHDRRHSYHQSLHAYLFWLLSMRASV